MLKKILIISITAIALLGCENNYYNNVTKKDPVVGDNSEKKEEIKKHDISLSEEEKNKLGQNKDLIRRALLEKALAEEISHTNFTQEDKVELDYLKKQVEIEYFLEKVANSKVTLKDSEVLKLYQDNLEKFKNYDINIVLPQLKNNILIERKNALKDQYLNELVNKYELDKKLDEYTKK